MDERERSDEQRVRVDEVGELAFEARQCRLLAPVAADAVGDRHLTQHEVVPIGHADRIVGETFGRLVVAERGMDHRLPHRHSAEQEGRAGLVRNCCGAVSIGECSGQVPQLHTRRRHRLLNGAGA